MGGWGKISLKSMWKDIEGQKQVYGKQLLDLKEYIPLRLTNRFYSFFSHQSTNLQEIFDIFYINGFYFIFTFQANLI